MVLSAVVPACVHSDQQRKAEALRRISGCNRPGWQPARISTLWTQLPAAADGAACLLRKLERSVSLENSERRTDASLTCKSTSCRRQRQAVAESAGLRREAERALPVWRASGSCLHAKRRHILSSRMHGVATRPWCPLLSRRPHPPPTHQALQRHVAKRRLGGCVEVDEQLQGGGVLNRRPPGCSQGGRSVRGREGSAGGAAMTGS